MPPGTLSRASGALAGKGARFSLEAGSRPAAWSTDVATN